MSELVKIGQLNPRSRNVNLIAKVVSKSPERVVSSQYDQKEHRLSEALIADETGAINLILWDDRIDEVREGSTIKVTNGFIKLFKGRMQLNLRRYGSVEEVDEVIEEVNLDNNLSETPQPQMSFGERRPPRRFRRR
ncbi:MAG: OB-fold nucleic acid binding domain-containing protein [Thaumarchaeota archaeon]|jgi:replication factor A1|nr:OB-fold nucleic acid binding domain-containing protein [Candidatus Wolframiiraptor allenii]